jgi:rare lipoprotein A (peptidoglycan hydrolase)
MGRWLVILSLVAVLCPDVAAASPKSPDVPLWKKLLSGLTQAPTPVRRDQAQPFRAVAKPNAPEPVAGSQVHKSTESTGADAGCNGGRRVISAFYRQGLRTASGQLFDPQGMTAAHRTLPFGTHLTVTNPRTGRSVTVVVNDRGPFVSGVVLDLSFSAAQAIGMHGTGAVCIW